MSAADTLYKAGTGAKGLAVGLAVLAATAAVGFVGWKAYTAAKAVSAAAGKAVDAVGTAVNPASDQNLAYRAAGAAVGCADGSCSFGTRIADGADWVRSLFNDKNVMW